MYNLEKCTKWYLCNFAQVSYLVHFIYWRNKFNFWSVHGIINTLGLLKSKWSPIGAWNHEHIGSRAKTLGFTLTLQETQISTNRMSALICIETVCTLEVFLNDEKRVIKKNKRAIVALNHSPVCTMCTSNISLIICDP